MFQKKELFENTKAPKNIKKKTKVTVYNAMIRSNIDSAAPVYGKLSKINQAKFNSIQQP